MGLAFVSYRRLDSAGHAGKVYDLLSAKYPRGQVFLDTGDLKPGDSWSPQLRAALIDSIVVLCVIGRSWDPKRLWETTDFVRQEITVALSKGRPVIPLLFDGVGPPRPEELPGECRAMLQYQAMSFDPWDREAYEYKIQQIPAAIERRVRAMFEAGDPQATSQIQVNGTFGIAEFKAYVDNVLVDDALPFIEGRGWVESVQFKVHVGFHTIKLTYRKEANDLMFGITFGLSRSTTFGEFHTFLESGKYVIDISSGWNGSRTAKPPRKV